MMDPAVLAFIGGLLGSLVGGALAGEISYKVFARKRDKHWVRVPED